MKLQISSAVRLAFLLGIGLSVMLLFLVWDRPFHSGRVVTLQVPSDAQSAKPSRLVAFAAIGNISPVSDSDLLIDKRTGTERLRTAHESALQHMLVEALEDSPDCNGMRLGLDPVTARRADFNLMVSVSGHDGGQQESWDWLLSQPRDSKWIANGSSQTAQMAAHDICRAARRQ